MHPKHQVFHWFRHPYKSIFRRFQMPLPLYLLILQFPAKLLLSQDIFFCLPDSLMLQFPMLTFYPNSWNSGFLFLWQISLSPWGTSFLSFFNFISYLLSLETKILFL